MATPAQRIQDLLAAAGQRLAAGDRAGARACHEEALRLAPGHPAALRGMAQLLLPAAPMEAAVHAQRALDAAPHDVEALGLMGQALSLLGRAEDALRAFQAAADHAPLLAQAHCNLCLALLRAGRAQEAAVAGERATRLNPRLPEGWTNLGHALNAVPDPARAMAAFQAALALRPEDPDALSGIATAQAALGRPSAAVAALMRAVEAAPGWANGWNDLAILLQEFGDPRGAREAAEQAALLAPDNPWFQGNLLMGMQYDPGFGEAAVAGRAREVGLALSARAPRREQRAAAPAEGRRLRIGYLSADFRQHPVGWLGAGAILAHDRAEVFVAAYASQTRRDALTDRLEAGVERWHWVHGRDDGQLAALVAADGIDILVDLSGHTAGNRMALFAGRAAPVQVSWLGWFATTGLPTMDAVLLDEDHLAPGAEALFSEEVVRLPAGRLGYMAPEYAPAPRMPPEGPVVFASFNNPAKLNAEVAALWARVLAAVPGSVLLLKWRGLSDPILQARLRALFGAAGGRLRFAEASPHAAMLDEYGDVDVALDPFPFTGALTTCEALWMGVPVVTLPGARPVSRQSHAILRRIGCGEWSCASPEEYVAVAARLAQDRAGRARLREGLRAAMAGSALCDHRGFAAGLEAAYRDLWARACGGWRGGGAAR